MASDKHRAAILRRRAAFLGSTLAVINCSPSAPDTPPEQPKPVVTVPDQPQPPPTDDDVPEPPPPTPKPTSNRPSYDVPAGVSETAKQNYERLHETMKEMHAILDAMEAKMPSCAIAKCEQDYRAEADQWHEIKNTLRLFYFCPGSSDEAKAFAEHKNAHREHLDARFAAVEKQLTDASTNAAEWERIRTEQAKPTPCLSFGCSDW